MEHKIIHREINSLIFAEYNPRQLTKDQYQNLKDSISRFGLVDPIIVNSNKERKNIIVGGHQRVKVAKDMDIEFVPVIEVDLSYDKERELNVRLNKNTGEWDMDVLANMFDMDELIDWGFNEKELNIFSDDEIYSKKIKSPIYEVKNSKPLISDVTDEEKKDTLIEKIEKSMATKEEKEFLKKAAMRHCVFNYAKIADYYVHSNNEMKQLMEESALVIVDYEKAIENGYVQMTEYMKDIQLDDE